MKPISEKQALERLARMKESFRSTINRNYEYRAKDCETCTTRGACCLDAHFVNVHVSRLEAVAIKAAIAGFPADLREKVHTRADEAIERYNLSDGEDSMTRTYACPLFEKGVGCLVHAVKPAACIAHACYEREEDLPPDALFDDVQAEIDRLNKRVYRNSQTWLPIPITLCEV